MPLMFLNGTAMSGQRDHACHSGSKFLGPAATSDGYRFFVVRDEFPGLYPVPEDGRRIEGELYDIPEHILRDNLLPAEPAELDLGTIELSEGEVVNAMILRPERLHPAHKVVDISELGGFRAYQRFLAANERTSETLGLR